MAPSSINVAIASFKPSGGGGTVSEVAQFKDVHALRSDLAQIRPQ
jgi:hypothetical protein